MKPVVDGLEKEYGDKVEFRRYNLERDPSGIDLANSLGVTAVPTFFFVNSDGVQAATRVGGMTEEDMRAAIEKLN